MLAEAAPASKEAKDPTVELRTVPSLRSDLRSLIKWTGGGWVMDQADGQQKLAGGDLCETGRGVSQSKEWPPSGIPAYTT